MKDRKYTSLIGVLAVRNKTEFSKVDYDLFVFIQSGNKKIVTTDCFLSEGQLDKIHL